VLLQGRGRDNVLLRIGFGMCCTERRVAWPMRGEVRVLVPLSII